MPSSLAFGFDSQWLFHSWSILLLVLGFGFVIFFHELGHFLAAKWVGIKVEQFAVGFGQALFSWRKGIGWRVGNTQQEYNQRIDDWLAKNEKGELPGNAAEERRRLAERELGLGETEYRLNWIPLGGYVKMLGQDDLRPNATADDPRSFNRRSIPARMLVVSAGVIMNVILAGIGFMVLFLIGFHVPPAMVGNIAPGSPAEHSYRLVNGKAEPAPLQVGDRIKDYNGSPQYDFTKIGLSAALSEAGVAVPIKVQHVDGSVETMMITPQKDEMNGGFLSLGIRQPSMLEGIDPKTADLVVPDWQQLTVPDALAVLPGEVITQVNGRDVKPDEFWKLDQALQNPGGKPVVLTVVNPRTKKTWYPLVHPVFETPFDDVQLNFAGLMPRASVPSLVDNSPARGKVLPGDVIVSVTRAGDPHADPSSEFLRKELDAAGQKNQPVDLVVLRDGKIQPPITGLVPSITVGKGRKGLGIGLSYDELHPVVADVEDNSAAQRAGIPPEATITAIDGRPVKTWFDVQKYLSSATPDRTVRVDYTRPPGPGATRPVAEHRDLQLDAAAIENVRGLRRTSFVALREYIEVRKADGPLQAAAWGVTETRDFILQFYLTLRRMAAGSVSPDQLMGPIGIFYGGAKFAFKGTDWLLWFLAMISANLAVVNFLPIPIVDGGLFTFLILEKIKGGPLSPRTHAIAQYVGLAFLAGVFLFVTYHDITRWFVG